MIKTETRHRASTSMYSLTFRVASPLQYGRNGTAHAAGVSILSPARGVFASMRSAWHCVRRVVGLADYRWALPRISIVLPQQRNPCTDCKSAQHCTTRRYPLQLAQVTSGSVQYLHSVGMRPQTDRHTDARNTIHFATSTTHAKCNKSHHFAMINLDHT